MGLSDQIKQPGQILGASSGASSGGNFGDLTGFPGASTDVMRGDGSAAPLSGDDVTTALGYWPAPIELLAAEATTRDAADSTKVPLAGTESMTGAIGITGSIARPSSSTINYGHTAGTTNRHYTNVPSGGLIVHEVSGSSVWYSSASGNNSYQPIVFNGTQTAPSTTANASWAESPGLILQGGSGSIVNQAKLTTRANSTAYSVCAYATGDVLRVHFQDGGSKRAVALVDASGTVTFEAGSHADYVASSSPASGEVGVYVTGGNLTIKPGSAGTRAIAVFVAKAKV